MRSEVYLRDHAELERHDGILRVPVGDGAQHLGHGGAQLIVRVVQHLHHGRQELVLKHDGARRGVLAHGGGRVERVRAQLKVGVVQALKNVLDSLRRARKRRRVKSDMLEKRKKSQKKS